MELIDQVMDALDCYICGREFPGGTPGRPRKWQGIRGRIPTRLGEPEPQVANAIVVRGEISDSQLPERWVFDTNNWPPELRQDDGKLPTVDALNGVIPFDASDPICDGDLIIDMCAIEGAVVEDRGDEILITFIWASSYPKWVQPTLGAKGRVRSYVHDGRPEMASGEVIDHVRNIVGLDEFYSRQISFDVEFATYETLGTFGLHEGGARVLKVSSGGGGSAPAATKDVMIVPKKPANPSTPELRNQKAYEQFGQDWVAAGSNRVLVHMDTDVGLDKAEEALVKAAKEADGGGNIYLNVGHGGVGGAIPTAGSTRHTDISGVDLVPWSTEAHRQMASTADLLASDVRNGVKVTDPALFVVKEMLGRVGVALRDHKVRLFSAIACNGGKDPRFGQELGKLLGIRVDLYEWLIYLGEDKDAHPLIWYNNDAPPAGTLRGQIPEADKQFLMTRDAAYRYAAEHGYQY